MGFFTRNIETKAVNPYDLVEPVDLIKYGYIPEYVPSLPSPSSPSPPYTHLQTIQRIKNSNRFTSRLPTITSLNPLTPSDLMRVLTDVRGALAKQYEALFAYSGVEIRFTTSALRMICERAIERGMGARGLRGIMESLLLESMFDVPCVLCFHASCFDLLRAAFGLLTFLFGTFSRAVRSFT